VRYRELLEEYKSKKRKIKERLKDFRSINKDKTKELFPELCFCLLTPQSNARYCDRAIQELKNTDLLFKGNKRAIRSILRGKARFHNKKAEYIIHARSCFDRNVFNSGNALRIRDHLVKNIKGMGYKEASHFLRNIGLGAEVAILDRHILKNLKRYGIIDNIPLSLTPRLYLKIEQKAKEFARRLNIPLDELDLLFWSRETGEIFK